MAILLSWIAASLFLGAIALRRILEGRLPDADDVHKLVRARDLLTGQGWFEWKPYDLGPAEALAVPWSQLADLPLAGLILLLSRFMDMAAAERVAIIALPLIVLLLFLLVAGRLAWRLFDRPTAVCVCLVAVLLPGVAMAFQPLRIDHTNWQIVAVGLAAWTLAWRTAPSGGAAAGLAMAFGLTLSFDLWLIAIAFGLLLALRWLRDHRERWWLVSYLQALALGLTVLFLLTRGPGAIAPSCLMISPPQLGMAIVMALGAGALAVFPPLPRVTLALAWTTIAALGAGFAMLLAPECSSPFAIAAMPNAPGIWPGFAGDAGPLWDRPLGEAAPALLQLALALVVALYLASIHRDWQRSWWFEYALLLSLAMAGSIVVARTLSFAGALSALPIGWFVARVLKRWRAHDGMLPRIALAAALVLVLAPGALVLLAQRI
ncbi:MAG: hypothetical protein ACO25F_00520 [Erythrobacter sp.]